MRFLYFKIYMLLTNYIPFFIEFFYVMKECMCQDIILHLRMKVTFIYLKRKMITWG